MAGELRGQIAFPKFAGVAYLSGAQRSPAVASNASGAGSLYLSADNVLYVTLGLAEVVGETAAQIELAGRCVARLAFASRSYWYCFFLMKVAPRVLRWCDSQYTLCALCCRLLNACTEAHALLP